jgi:hypothetical protein
MTASETTTLGRLGLVQMPVFRVGAASLPPKLRSKVPIAVHQGASTIRTDQGYRKGSATAPLDGGGPMRPRGWTTSKGRSTSETGSWTPRTIENAQLAMLDAIDVRAYADKRGKVASV